MIRQSDFDILAINDADLLWQTGKINAAVQKLERVLEIEPNNSRARSMLIRIEEQQEQREAERRSHRFWGYYPTYPLKPIYQ